MHTCMHARGACSAARAPRVQLHHAAAVGVPEDGLALRAARVAPLAVGGDVEAHAKVGGAAGELAQARAGEHLCRHAMHMPYT